MIQPKDDRANRIHDVFARRCHDDKWSADVLGCIRDEPAMNSGRHCLDKLDSEQRSKLSRELVVAEKPDLPHECEAYKVAQAKLNKCDKYPQATRDQYKTIYDQAASTWEDRTRGNLTSITTQCKDNAEMVDQVLKAMGC